MDNFTILILWSAIIWIGVSCVLMNCIINDQSEQTASLKRRRSMILLSIFWPFVLVYDVGDLIIRFFYKIFLYVIYVFRFVTKKNFNE